MSEWSAVLLDELFRALLEELMTGHISTILLTEVSHFKE